MTNPAIIFDLDGTLAHTAPNLIATLNRVCKPYELAPVDFSMVGQIVGHGAKAMLTRTFELNGKTLSEENMEHLFSAFLEDYTNNLASETHMFDGLDALLPELVADGYTLCVCTNKMEGMARQLLEDLQQMQYFSSLTGGDSFSFRKPDPRHLEETLALAGCKLADAIMVGDSVTDIKAAQNAGIPSIAVTFGYSDVPVETLGATHVISDYGEFWDVLKSIRA